MTVGPFAAMEETTLPSLSAPPHGKSKTVAKPSGEAFRPDKLSRDDGR
uniref:Uncharacterized protein n=1 Tax=Tetraselmis sp. GSL018 TaxID=582737 RepID=A0A061RN79_9CHLO